jgi:hypothetical protein
MLICGVGVVAGRIRAVADTLPNVDYAQRFVGQLIGIVALFFSNSPWAAPHLYVGAYGATTMFARLPWLAQLTLQLLCLAVPTIAFAHLGTFPMLDAWPITALVIVVIVVYVRYTWSRAMCEQFSAALLAQSAVLATLGKAEHQHALLAGVLPAHAIAIAKGRIAAGVEQGYVREFHGLSVLQVVTRGDGAVDVAAVLATVNSGNLLEMVQTMGDTYLIAGPFKNGVDDVTMHSTAICAVQLLMALCPQCDADGMGFTAFATAGPAFAALLGAANMNFRLFGAAVRENVALLAASPQSDAPAGTPGCVAFCTEGFRRQHANYAPVSTKRFDAEPGMSIALGGRSAVFGASDARPRSPASATASSASPSRHSDDVFSEPSLWRVRGVGVASVRAVRLGLATPSTFLPDSCDASRDASRELSSIGK